MTEPDAFHRTLRRQMARCGLRPDDISDERFHDLLTRVSSAYDDAEKQRYLHDRAFLLASTEMQTLYDRLEQASQSAAAIQRDRLKAVFDTAASGLIVLEADSRVADINQVAEAVLGITGQEVADTDLGGLLMPAKDLDPALQELRHAIQEGKNWRSPDTLVRSRNGVTFSAALFYRAMKTGGGVLAIEDITERKQAQAELLWRANHDPLTGLLNRAALMEQIHRALQRARRYQHQMAILFLDLDRFKRVNDTLGHAAGDSLLVDCSRRIGSVMREVDTVARLGGDEFVIVCENLTENPEADVRIIAHRLVQEIAKPFDIGDDVAFVDASIGMAISDGYGMEPDQILRDADVALYEAKEHIGSAVIVYTESMITRIQHALDLERRLRKGLARDEFWVAYQPIFDLADQRFLGYEALARWTSEDDETILPNDFVAVAESAGLLNEIGRGVISKALEFHATCPPGTLMFVNMAPSQIAADGIVEWFQATLARSGADATSIYLEITEMTAFTDYGIQPRLEELRALGIRVALDDFGVGHSSLASLHNLSVDLIKVAPSFLADATHDARAKVTARMVCELGATLGIDVIAEGVETPEHLQILTEIGCTLGQGFFLGEPRPAQTATQYLPG